MTSNFEINNSASKIVHESKASPKSVQTHGHNVQLKNNVNRALAQIIKNVTLIQNTVNETGIITEQQRVILKQQHEYLTKITYTLEKNLSPEQLNHIKKINSMIIQLDANPPNIKKHIDKIDEKIVSFVSTILNAHQNKDLSKEEISHIVKTQVNDLQRWEKALSNLEIKNPEAHSKVMSQVNRMKKALTIANTILSELEIPVEKKASTPKPLPKVKRPRTRSSASLSTPRLETLKGQRVFNVDGIGEYQRKKLDSKEQLVVSQSLKAIESNKLDYQACLEAVQAPAFFKSTTEESTSTHIENLINRLQKQTKSMSLEQKEQLADAISHKLKEGDLNLNDKMLLSDFSKSLTTVKDSIQFLKLIKPIDLQNELGLTAFHEVVFNYDLYISSDRDKPSDHIKDLVENVSRLIKGMPKSQCIAIASKLKFMISYTSDNSQLNSADLRLLKGLYVVVSGQILKIDGLASTTNTKLPAAAKIAHDLNNKTRDLFSKIDSNEFRDKKNWTESKGKSIAPYMNHLNQIKHWGAEMILNAKTPEQRANNFAILTNVIKELIELNDFASAQQVLMAITTDGIPSDLYETKKLISQKDKDYLASLEKGGIFDVSNNFANLSKHIKDNGITSYTPPLTIFKTILFTIEGNEKYTTDLRRQAEQFEKEIQKKYVDQYKHLSSEKITTLLNSDIMQSQIGEELKSKLLDYILTYKLSIQYQKKERGLTTEKAFEKAKIEAQIILADSDKLKEKSEEFNLDFEIQNALTSLRKGEEEALFSRVINLAGGSVIQQIHQNESNSSTTLKTHVGIQISEFKPWSDDMKKPQLSKLAKLEPKT